MTTRPVLDAEPATLRSSCLVQEELFVGKQVDGTFPQYRFDGRLFDTFNWCECKAWADSERFCLDYVGQHNG